MPLEGLTELDSPITYGVVKPGAEGDVAFVRGGDLSGGKVLKHALRTITQEVSNQYRRTLLRGGELLICLVGQPGQVAVVPKSLAGANIARQVGLIRLRADVDAEFVSYFLQSPQGQQRLGMYTGGAVQQVINLSDLRRVLVPVPALPEQQRIVGVLDQALAGLATAQAHAKKNLQNSRALFETYLESVFAQRGKRWVQKALSDVCAITSALVDPRKKEFFDMTHVGAANIESSTGALIDLRTAREEGLISGKFLFDKTMVLYSKIRPYLQKVARPDFNGLCSADMYPLAPISSVVTRDFLFHLLLSKSLTEYAIKGSARAGIPKVNREHLFAFKLWLPELKVQRQLAANLDTVFAETQRLENLYRQKHVALTALKASLLHQAFSGAF